MIRIDRVGHGEQKKKKKKKKNGEWGAAIHIHTSEVTEVTPGQLQQPGSIDNKSLRKRISQSVNQLMTAVCRTATATPGLLTRQGSCVGSRPFPF